MNCCKSLVWMAMTAVAVLVWLPAWPAGAEDWPTVQHDNTRRGYTPVEVRPTDYDGKEPKYKLKWAYDFKSFIEQYAQPVIVEGRIFLGAQDGKLRAIDAETGKDMWAFPTGGPIMNSAAVAGGKVFFGSHDGNIYCLSASDGKELWRFATGAGVWTAPCVDDGVVYMGSRDGVFYAIDVATGKSRWTRDCGSPIRQTAACDKEFVFFGPDNMTATCLRKSDGQVVWQKKVSGDRFYPYWPVVYEDVTIWTTQTPGLIKEVWEHANQNVAKDKPIVQALVDYYQKFPQRRMTHALDRKTGEVKYILPICRMVGNEGTITPPAISPAGDAFFITYLKGKTAAGMTDRYVSQGGLDQCQLARFGLAGGYDFMDPKDSEGVADGFYASNKAPQNVRGKTVDHLNWCSDETCVVSMMGNMVLTNHQSRAAVVDLNTNRSYVVAWTEPDRPEYKLLQFYAAEHNGPVKSPMAVAGNKIFLTWHVQFLVAVEGVETKPATQPAGDSAVTTQPVQSGGAK